MRWLKGASKSIVRINSIYFLIKNVNFVYTLISKDMHQNQDEITHKTAKTS